VQGATVAFELTSAGSDIIPHEKITDANGMADTRIVLGTTVGRQTGNVWVVTQVGRPPVQADFTAIALSENANSMAAVTGQDQSGNVGSPLDDRLVVEVTDGFGNPVEGVLISWVAEGGGSVSDAVVATDEDGRSRVERTLGPTVGQQTTVASSAGLAGSPVTFVHTALAGDASRLVAVSGNGQSATVGSALPADLVVRLVDADGNGIPATAVSWVVATGGGSADPEIGTTDDGGLTSARWTLGGAVGEQRLDAVVSGVGVASFRATATSPAPASLSILTQPSASARNGVPFGRQPVIQLRDGQGHEVGVAGVQVSAAIGSGGGDLGGSTRSTTDASGRAAFTDLSISGVPGRRTLLFTASGLAGVTSNEIDVTTAGTTTTITGDAPDPSIANSEFPVQFRVTSSGATPTGTVTVTVSGGPATCTGTLTSGVGSCTLRLGGLGARTLTATYSGGPGLSGSSDTEPHTVISQPLTNQAPTAAFTSSCANLGCSFDSGGSNDPDGSIVSWSWDFGDGATSEARSPSHTYGQAGTYQVVLTVRDDDGASGTVSHSVTVNGPPPPPNKPPKAEFQVSCANLTCSFSDQSQDDDGSVATWHWDFGDGQSSDAQNPSHSYNTAGSYNVTLTITDDDGAPDSKTHDAKPTAPPNQPPTAAFSPPSCTAGQDCQFTDGSSDSDGTIVSWNWDFKDGGTSGLENPTHNFSTDGTFKVKLTVTDNDGVDRSVEHDVIVAPAPPPPNQAPAAGDDSYTTPQDVPLIVAGPGVLADDSDPDGDNLTAAIVSSTPNGSLSLASDGSFSYTPNAGFTGSDTFTYQASDGSLSDSATVTITIGGP
jgi:PKD repeat protein